MEAELIIAFVCLTASLSASKKAWAEAEEMCTHQAK